MRADSKLQWRFVIVIFELQSVHMRKKTLPNSRFSIQSEEKKHGSFLCLFDLPMAISFEIEFLIDVRFIGGSG